MLFLKSRYAYRRAPWTRKEIIRHWVLIHAIMTALIVGAIFYTDSQAATHSLRKVEAKYVCMINNQLMDKEQIPVTVNGKTYYGCCPMCKEKLEKSAQARTATDPVSNKPVDKASAIIGAAPDGKVQYFENEKNFKAYGN